MLTHYDRRVHGDDFPARESLGHQCLRLFVFFPLPIHWHDDRAVNDKEVGIGSGQPLAVEYHLVWHGQLEQPVWLALNGCQGLQLRLQRLEVGVLLISLIVATHI